MKLPRPVRSHYYFILLTFTLLFAQSLGLINTVGDSYVEFRGKAPGDPADQIRDLRWDIPRKLFDNSNSFPHAHGIVKASIDRSIREGLFHSHGFLFKAPFNAPYYQNPGGANLLFGSAAPSSPEGLPEYVARLSFLLSLLFAALGTLLAHKTKNLWGWGAGIAVSLGIFSSNFLIYFSNNLYFVGPVLLLHILASLCYPHRRWSLLVFFCSILQSIFYYEFVTNTILCATTLPTYYAFFDRQNKKIHLRAALNACIMACLGLLSVMTLHLGRLWLIFGSLREAADLLIHHALHRTLDYNNTPSYWAAEANYITIMSDYMRVKVISFVTPYFAIQFDSFDVLLVVVATFLIYRLFATRKERARSPSLEALYLSMPAYLLFSLSWSFQSHMYEHLNICPIIFYLPFLIFAFVLFGLFCETITRPELRLSL